MSDLSQRIAQIEATFRAIQDERFAGVPILHPKLRVEAVSFRHWHGYTLGVLITPWFMNLMLLPVQPDEWDGLHIGTAQRFIFPAGEYDFLLAHDVGIGYYRTCSLFSPMSMFADQAQAIATAESVMEELFREAKPTTPSQLPLDADKQFANEVKRHVERPLSRRDLLRGAFLRGGK